jgi:hypothetical protein
MVFFAHCEAKGCKARKVFAAQQTRRARGIELPLYRDECGELWDMINDPVFAPAKYAPVAQALGVYCPDHGCMRVSVLRAKYNPEKVCDARCTGAKGPACECSCRGERHGIGAV